MADHCKVRLTKKACEIHFNHERELTGLEVRVVHDTPQKESRGELSVEDKPGLDLLPES